MGSMSTMIDKVDRRTFSESEPMLKNQARIAIKREMPASL